MKILLVEDEHHKIADLLKRLENVVMQPYDVETVRSVKDAVLAVTVSDFELVILDMALPTFAKDKSDSESGGLAQSSGGIEVLRALQHTGRRVRVIIVTQYPDITISGELVKFKRLPSVLRKRYNQEVLGVVLYSYNDGLWATSFDQLMGRLL